MLLPDAYGCSLRIAEPGQNVPPRRLGKAVAVRRKHGRLHDCARRASSRAGVYVGPPARIPLADEMHLWDLGLGETMEGVRIHPAALAAAGESRPPVHEGGHFWREWFHRGCAPRARRLRGPAQSPR